MSTHRFLATAALVSLAACGAPPPSVESPDAGSTQSTADAGSTPPAADAGSTETAADAGTPQQPVDDGTPTRQQCSNTYGREITPGFGRLDGYLVAIVPPGQRGCNGDSDHVHLQLRVQGALYDVAVTAVDRGGVPVDFLEKDLAMPDGAWQEGWHTGVHLDYTQLGLHAQDFAPTPPDDLRAKVEDALREANHLSVFATGYTDHTGAHKVHRNGFGEDGAIVIEPTAPTSHLLLFHFTTQSF